MERVKSTRKKDGDMAADEAAEYDEVFTFAYGAKDAEPATDPFRKRTSLARTPPLRRTISLPTEGQVEDRDKGREEDKTTEDSTRETAKKPRGVKASSGDIVSENCRDRILSKVAHLIQRVDEDVEVLFNITSGSRNTKVEIKELAEDLPTLTKELTGVDLAAIGGNKKQRTKNWSPDLFVCTEVKDGGDILDTKDSVIKVVVSLKANNELRNKRVWDRYPELLASSEDYAVLDQISNLRGDNDRTVSRKIIKINTGRTDEDLWEKLVRVREEAGPDGWVAVQQVPSRSVGSFRKMLECVFLRASARVAIYADKECPQKRNQKGQEIQKKERDTGALVVESSGGETYTEVLRRVKERVRKSTVSSKIKGLRSTRDGRLLITMDKDPTVAERVAEILGEPAQQLKVSKTGQRSKELALQIRGIDALTSKQDVVEALEGRIGPLKGKSFRISELRPNAGTTLAVTFVTNKEDAVRVMGDGTLRIGLVNCRVEQILEVKRCFRCWSYEHKARDCDGVVDRSRLCYRCGAEGHNAKVCDKEEACPVCGVGGHTADSRRCRFFKKALAQARETEGLKASRDTRGGRQTQTRTMPTEINEPNGGPEPTGALEPILIN